MNLLNFTGLIVVPLVSSPIVYLAGRLGTRETTLRGRSYLVRVLAFLAVLAAWVPFIVSAQTFFLSGTQQFNVNMIWLRVDGISLLMAGSVLLLGTLVILFSGSYMAGEVGEEKYYAMLLAMMGLMIGLVSASDLFNMWVWFEAMAISSYLLVPFYREQSASLEAGMKYLVQSTTGSVLVLIGVAIVLAQAGTLDMAEITAAVAGSEVNRFALLGAGALFLIGFGVKVALVPLHTWLPDAHSQAPSGISAMLSGVVIEIGLIAMLRALAVLTGFVVSWGILLMGFGALNILYGNLLALRQSVIKRLLAYSSLSHIGYILLGLGIALYSGIQLGAQGAFFHVFNHMLMKGLAFLAVGA
ncbi:MAG: complex I subunit 5 family protein, partial [Anaerolineales bacterium]